MSRFEKVARRCVGGEGGGGLSFVMKLFMLVKAVKAAIVEQKRA